MPDRHYDRPEQPIPAVQAGRLTGPDRRAERVSFLRAEQLSHAHTALRRGVAKRPPTIDRSPPQHPRGQCLRAKGNALQADTTLQTSKLGHRTVPGGDGPNALSEQGDGLVAWRKINRRVQAVAQAFTPRL